MKLDEKKSGSILKLIKVYVSKTNYQSDNTLEIDEKNKKLYSFECFFEPKGDTLNVNLLASVAIENTQEKLDMEICGVFEIVGEPDSPEKMKLLLTQNTVAIIFPYLRTYVSNFSSMTNMGNVTIPIFNIAKALSKNNNKKEELSGD